MSEPKTVRVRIAVAIVETGEWSATGYSGFTDVDAMDSAIDGLRHDAFARFIVTADLPVPTVPDVAGTVEEAKL